MGVKVREKVKGSGVYWVFIDHGGKRKAKKIGTDLENAREVARKIEARLTLKDFGFLEREQTTPAFRTYAEAWLNDYVKPLRRPGTLERYDCILRRYITPVLKEKPIGEIGKGDIRDILLSIYRKGLSRSTVCVARDVLSGLFNYAVDDEIIAVNPVAGLTRRLNMDRERDEIEPFTREEVDAFLSAAQSYRPDYYPLFLTAFRTGIRLGELLALEWADIDFRGHFIFIRKSFKRGKISQTKTGKRRRVDMSDQLEATLKGLLVRRKKEALKRGKGEPFSFLFHEKGGAPLSQNTVRNVFKALLGKAGMRSARIHDMRHTFASLLLSDGESPVYVKEQLGHASIQMTVDIYGHLIPSSNREAVNRLDAQPAATYPQPAKM